MSSYVTELMGLAKRYKREEQDIFDVSDAAEVGVEIIEHLEERIAELEAKNKRLDEAAKAILEATIAETVEKAAFVDEMCKALGVTFEALVNDDSVKAGIEEKDDE